MRIKVRHGGKMDFALARAWRIWDNIRVTKQHKKEHQMIRVNENYLKIQASYLFTEIAHRVKAHQEAHPSI